MFRKTLIILAMLFAILGPGAKAWGQTTASVELCTSWDKTLAYTTAYTQDYTINNLDGGTTTMTLGVQGVYRQSKTDTYFQMNKKDGYFKNTTKLPGKITKIETTWSATKGPTKCYFAENAEASSSDKTVTVTAATSVTYTPPTNADYYYFNIDVSTGSGSAQMTSCKVYYEKSNTPAAELVSISISGTPDKTTYEAGEEFDPAGLVVTGTYDTGDSEEITSGIDWTITPNPLTAGTTSVSVTAKVGEVESPAYQVNGLTVKARTLYSFGFETATSLDWDFENMASMQTHSNVTAHSGSYFGTTGAKNTASMTTKSAVAKPGILTCYVSKQSTNTTSSTWKIQISSDNKSSWTDVKTQDATSMTVGTWVEFTADLSSYKNVYVRIYYTGSTAVRNIDDVSLTLAKDVQSISVMTAPTKTTYNVGENFDPAGLVITATYDDESTEDIAYAGNESKFTFEPNLETALTTANDKVTITYGGKSCDQAITVNLNKLATPTNLQATNVTSTSATLTWDAVENASSYDVKLSGKTRTSETNSLLVESLTASITYTWTVKAKGDGTTYEDSEESTTNEFTTLAPPTVTYTVTFNGNEHGTPASESITETEAGAGITLPEVTPNTGYQFIGWATTSDATEADAGEAGATYHPFDNITLYAVYNRVYTITWSVNGSPTTDGNPTTSVVAGEGITTLPTAPASISGMAFQGWTATQIATSSATAPTDLFTDAEHAPAITDNTTFYAVFAEESEGDVTWNNVTTLAGITEGTYVLVSEKTANTYKYMPNTESSGSNPTLGGGITINNNVLTNEIASNMPWSLVSTGTTNEYYIRPYGNDKIGLGTTNSTGTNIRISSSYKDTKWTIATNETANWQIKNDNTTSMYLAVYSDDAWRNYSNATTNQNGKFYFFKKTQDITYTYYTNVVVKQLTSITLSGEYPTEFWKGETFSHEGMTVTAHYSNADDEDVTDKATFTGYDMAAAGEQTVTVTYEGKTETYSITVKTIANTQATAYTTAKAKELIDAGKDLGTEVYVKGTVSKVDKIESGAITYWLDENAFEVYKGKNIEGADFTNVNEIAVGDDVIIYGKIKKYYSTYEFDSGNYLVSHVKVATLSIDDITVEIGGTITPVIETNVVGDYTISYTSDNEEVVLADGDEMVTMGLGEATITATLTAEGYKDAETTFTVEVIKALTSITVATEPTVTDYKAGDKFDPTGLVITATYSEGEPEDIAYEDNEDKFTFEPSLETELTTDITSVTITYAGKETTQEIEVRALYTYDITWMANGEQFTATQVTEGNTLVLPETSPDNVGDMKFQGWIDSENYYSVETAPEYIVPDEIIPIEAMTFYAVYAKEEESETTSVTKDIIDEAGLSSSVTLNADNNPYQIGELPITLTGIKGSSNYPALNYNATNGTDLRFYKGTTCGVTFATTNNQPITKIEFKKNASTASTLGNSFSVNVGTLSDNVWTGSAESVTITYSNANSNFSGQMYIVNVTYSEKVPSIYSNFCTTVKPIEENTIISSNTTWDGNYTINEHTVTIESGAVLTVNGALINTDPEKLIIEDGAQLIFNNAGGSKDNNINSGVKATVEKKMDEHGYWGKSENPKAGWYFLAAPMTDFAVASFIEQAGTGGYDLYRWCIINGTPIWYNYKAHTIDFETNFVSGRGYLAAYQTTDLLEMKGTLNAGTEFEFTNELNSKGNFTLLGNPFTYDLNWSEFTMTDVYNGFAVVDSEDGIIEYVAGTTPIKVGTGFMVYTEDDGAELSFTKGSESGKSNDILALNLFASNGNGEDNTIIVLDDKNGGFAKADNFNTNVPQIYTERLQTKYGIRNFSTNTKEFFVSFKAVGEGSNTIRLETIGEFDYVHLYDKLLDVDVDMLLEGSYTFEASEGDDTHRFIVRIDKGNTGIDENETENFVNVYNGEIHVSGSGEVQIFDVMGRMVHSEVISGDATISTGGFKGGVYVVRLIGNGWTKTEKIVVRR